MSSISDPYQPIEKKLKMTRKILENLDKNAKLSILTKSDLILRDIDILNKFKNLEIGLTINSIDDKYKDIIEPNSPTNLQRIRALEKLKNNGFRTYAFISPIIPGFTDIEKLIKNTKNYVDFYWFEFINLRGAGQKFSQFLKDTFPESYEILTDKRLFKKYVEDFRKRVRKYKINIKGIEVH